MKKTLIFFWLATFVGQIFPFVNQPDENGERYIVLVTASYNNKDWYKGNLDSVFNQNYKNWHLIYVDDNSPDGTAQLVEEYIKEKGQKGKVTLIKNKEHKGAMYNQYHAIHTCPDHAIIGILDGDDKLADPDVLKYLNGIYSDNHTWLTYGQFREYPYNNLGFCHDMPAEVAQNNAFRDYVDIPSHMRTFYAGLFKQIKKEDLIYEGNFFEMDADIAAMFPMIEMARDHFKFISRVLYIYNGANSLNDHKRSKTLQRQLDLHIRSKQRYEKVNSPIRSEN